MIVDIFIPCFVDQCYPETAFSMVKILEKLGCTVHYNKGQTCCGQPGYNAGFFDEAKLVADKFLKDFSDKDRYIVAPSASCVGMVRNSYERFYLGTDKEADFKHLQSHIFEFTEFLLDVLKIESFDLAQLDGTFTYHDSCSALRECGIKAGPRKLLAGVKGLKLSEMIDNETCCGFGGTFAIKFEQISTGMAAQKLENAKAAGADYIISTDTSCLMHLDAYIRAEKLPIKALHIADVLATGW